MITSLKREWLLFGGLFVLAVALRFYYWDVFYGWEESDYGNLAMVQGVYDSGFTSFDMNHMPGFYAMSALLLSIVDDTVIASKLVALLGGMCAFALTVYLARQLSGFFVAIVVSLLLCFQPEFSLYSASALREPLYSSFMLGFLFFVFKEKPFWAAFMAFMAFSIRFEAPLACLPLLFFLLFNRQKRLALIPLMGFCIAAGLWALYCYLVYETPQFWSHSASVNVETGLGLEATSTWEWLQNGALVSLSLLFELLPSRVGWLVFIGWLASPWLVNKNSKLMLSVVMSYGMVFVWLAIAFISQHEPTHNLYWKWLMPFVPLVTWVGVASFALLLLNLSKGASWVGWSFLIGQGLIGHFYETDHQLRRAERLYKPQVDLAKKIECSGLTGKQYLIDNIPACWIRRRPTDLKMISWFDVELRSSGADGFSEWIEENDIAAVLWFKEDWTQAPKKAPFLADGQPWVHGDVIFEPTAKDLHPNGYGWVFYERIDSGFRPMQNCD